MHGPFNAAACLCNRGPRQVAGPRLAQRDAADLPLVRCESFHLLQHSSNGTLLIALVGWKLSARVFRHAAVKGSPIRSCLPIVATGSRLAGSMS
jgi:hypothetical protein